MIVLRCLRPDRLITACTEFIYDKLGKDFIETKPAWLADIYEDSKEDKEPIIFILSPGVDPSDRLTALARQLNQTVENVSLGRG